MTAQTSTGDTATRAMHRRVTQPLAYPVAVDAVFFDVASREGLTFLEALDFETDCAPGEVPGDLIGRADYREVPRTECLTRLGSSLAHFVFFGTERLHVRVASPDLQEALMLSGRLASHLERA